MKEKMATKISLEDRKGRSFIIGVGVTAEVNNGKMHDIRLVTAEMKFLF